jgi:hypothetical protein
MDLPLGFPAKIAWMVQIVSHYIALVRKRNGDNAIIAAKRENGVIETVIKHKYVST